ncbi:MAG: serine/threonine-protein kinase [Holophagaceae bacterium]|nr:serine/threonine-protein kinase [Holophagaceae bacterium]
MSLQPGTKLGPYEILAPLGEGSMGEVWKAKDTKLDRFVAIKVLPGHLAAHPEALARFEREAKALAALQHPNVMGIFDFAAEGDFSYAVMELLEGETLRAVIDRGPLAHRRAVEIAGQIALGLAAAHGKGIIHRDLKPENVFVLRDGRVKLLDFGLAKTHAALARVDAGTLPTTAAPGTAEGAMLGTVGYMSPEQARGEPADARSDIFSFGCLLYELVAGHRPFEGATAVDVLHGILHADVALDETDLSPGLRRILQHCLDKNPAQRFQSAQDLAFALESSVSTTRDPGSLAPRGMLSRPPGRSRLRPLLLGAVLLVAGAGAGAWAAHHLLQKPLPSFRRITFRRGNVLHARFTPDGQNVVYSAAWDGRPTEIFLSRADGSGSRPLGITGATVQSVNAKGDLLVILKPGALSATTAGAGTLAQATLDGGAPRELLERVWSADYGPDGKGFAAAYQASEGGPFRLDYPLGTRLLESPGVPLTSIRVSPKGDLVALAVNDPGASVLMVVDLQGHSRVLYRAVRSSEADLAWAPDGSRLYIMDGESLVAVAMDGTARRIHNDSTLSAVHHVSSSGRMLVEREVIRRTTLVRRDGQETSLGWQEFTRLVDLSRDGDWALLDESGGRLGPGGQPLLRRTDGSPPKLLEPGVPLALSPDGQQVLIRLHDRPARLRLVPTGAGVSRDLALVGWDLLEGAFAPDGATVYAVGRQGEGPTRILAFPLAGGPGTVLASPLPRFEEITPDGRQFVALDDQRRILLAPVSGGPAAPAAGALEDGDFLVGWNLGGELRVAHAVDAARLRLDLLDLRSGQRRTWMTLAPPDPTGAVRIRAAKATLDGRTVAFTTGLVDVSDLLVVDGLK